MARTNKLTVVGLTLWVLGTALACTQLLGDVCVDDAKHDCKGAGAIIAANQPQEQTPVTSGPAPCEQADALRCNSEEFQICKQSQAGLAWLTLDVCDSAELCATEGTTVAGCRPPVCHEGDMRCEGATLQMCNETLTGYNDFAACESAAHCDATGRACRAVPCEPGMLRCNGPELQSCRQDQLDWELVAGGTCATNELCEAARTRDPALGPLPSGGVCPDPECDAGALRCTDAALEQCNVGRTAWNAVETCASPALCELGRTNAAATPGASPSCGQQACSAGGYECAPGGELRQCNADLTAYELVRQCAQASQCNATRGTCTDEPCQPGEEQCSGNTILRCTDDRLDLVPTGEVCATAALCNDDLPAAPGTPVNAICNPPVCTPNTADEFICQGATLLKCNADRTAYEFFQGCATAALCNPSRRTDGCIPPTCQPNQFSCSDTGVLSICNSSLNGFQPRENCRSRAQCDATLGRCTDPCVVGAARCNQQGNLEECRDPLVGWEVTAPCNSVARCDATARACRDCDPANPLFCQGNVLRRCNATGFGSVVAPAADGCANATNRRQCLNGVLQTPSCSNGNACDGNESCVAGACVRGTAVACPDDGNICNGQTGCNTQTGACNVAGTNAVAGTQCPAGVCNGAGACVGCNPGDTCSDGNACTNDSCNTTRASCDHVAKCTGATDVCIPGTGTCVECMTGADCPANRQICLNNVCVACTANQCNAQGQFVACTSGQLQPAVSCADAFSCTTDACTTQGCTHTNSNAACSDSNACTGTETCNPGAATADTRGCVAGTPLAVGATCGTGQACNSARACITAACTSDTQCAAATTCTQAQNCNLNTLTCVGGGATNNGERCDPPGTPTVGICRGGECSPTGCIDDTDCGTGTPECVAGVCVQCDFAAPRCSLTGQLETCTNGRLSIDTCGGFGCTGTVCNTCSVNTCDRAGNFIACVGGQAQAPVSCLTQPAPICNQPVCTTTGCATAPVENGTVCQDIIGIPLATCQGGVCQ